jgi:hypothetical protein
LPVLHYLYLIRIRVRGALPLFLIYIFTAYSSEVFKLGYSYLRRTRSPGCVKTYQWKRNTGTAWTLNQFWSSYSSKIYAQNGGAGMPKTSSVVSLTGQSHINNS